MYPLKIKAKTIQNTPLAAGNCIWISFDKFFDKLLLRLTNGSGNAQTRKILRRSKPRCWNPALASRRCVSSSRRVIRRQDWVARTGSFRQFFGGGVSDRNGFDFP